MGNRAVKARAVIDVVFVYLIALGAVVLIVRSPVGRWERASALRPWAEYFVMALVALIAIVVSRIPLASFGIRRNGLAAQVDAALKCVMVFALGKAIVFLLGPRQMVHSIVEPVVALAVIAACAWMLRPRLAVPAVALVLIIPLVSRFSFSALLFYPLLLGPAEELLFRGYIQSRLNVAFDRPYRVAGARFGAGLLVTSVLFSIFHIVNLPALAAGRIDPQWVTALPTFSWGIALGYVRERTDSLLPAAVSHGVPQGIAWAFLGR